MTKEFAQSLCISAGFTVLRMEELTDGCSYRSDDPRFFTTLPAQVWWFVKTPEGWLKIGRLRRVWTIDWEDTGYKTDEPITTDDVTKERTYVHAYSPSDIVKYLAELKHRLRGPAVKACASDSDNK